MPKEIDTPRDRRPRLATAAAAVVGLLLVWQAALASSATYDETTYLNAGSRWWREGDRVGVTRMGSPNLFWKIQLAPAFATLDLLGKGDLIADQPRRQAELLPLARIGASWIWLAGFGLVAWWARRLNGPWAIAFAVWLYALSPNLIAHGALVTMEMPVTVATVALFLAFHAFLTTGRRRWFWTSATLAGLAFACKFTVVLYPPILGLVWWLDGMSRDEDLAARLRRTGRVAIGMAGYVAVLLASDFALTGFAVLPLSPATGEHPSVARFGALSPLVARLYETPIPQDWVGFAGQVRHQASGGPGYLLGERKLGGWRSYYLIAAAVKVPLVFWLLVACRLRLDGVKGCLANAPDRMLLQAMLLFLAVASAGSSRNYGVRYLLPMAPLAIVWVSRLARAEGVEGAGLPRLGRTRRAILVVGLLGQAVAVASVHPDELTYFNAIAGGRVGGRRILADSNLDWGQGLRSLARLQRERPEFRDLTLYYFGDVDPAFYGVVGDLHVINADEDRPPLPRVEDATTRYVAVSASLQHGPWGPDDFFRSLDGAEAAAWTEDTTIVVYRAAEARRAAPPG
ncbi:ArnT family glycosyltransferase [Paludisphaera soli]|uniref:ArnT family glycosyltransferase n=1 Tax=Paludisphaera soli TaxID=2712865 RepID=UPI0013EB663D|nr:glycosyltransferase family 39 protein [Paludisphaera soli]